MKEPVWLTCLNVACVVIAFTIAITFILMPKYSPVVKCIKEVSGVCVEYKSIK